MLRPSTSHLCLTLQANHRQALADAAGRLRELEARRVAALKDVVATFLSSYPCAHLGCWWCLMGPCRPCICATANVSHRCCVARWLAASRLCTPSRRCQAALQPAGMTAPRPCSAALLPAVEEQAALPDLLARVEPGAGAAELDLAAATAQAASSQLAARQGEALECVTQELLCNPEILRWAPHLGRHAHAGPTYSHTAVISHPPVLGCAYLAVCKAHLASYCHGVLAEVRTRG